MYHRDGNRYRHVRPVPCGLIAVRQRRLYDYGFQRRDDMYHPIQWLLKRYFGKA